MDKKRDDDELLRWKEVFDNTSWGMLLATPDSRFIVVNRAFAVMHGTAPEDWIGRSLRDMFAEDDKAALPDRVRRAHEHGCLTYESMHVRADGTTFPVLTEVTVFKDAAGRVRYRAANFQDISARIQIERELAEERDRLRVAVAARDEFLAVAAHELRTPLTTLALQLDAVSDDLERGPAFPDAVEGERMRRRLDVFGRQVARLTTLVESLLDVTRIGASPLELQLEDVDLGALAREVAGRFRDAAAHAGSTLTVDASATVTAVCDRIRIDQALTHLLTNAVKYGAARPIVVEVAAAGDNALLTVHDEGIGVSDADRERIFGRYERAVSSNQYGGLGLGLFIVEQIVRAHGGAIDVTSTPGRGSSFAIRLSRTR